MMEVTFELVVDQYTSIQSLCDDIDETKSAIESGRKIPINNEFFPISPNSFSYNISTLEIETTKG